MWEDPFLLFHEVSPHCYELSSKKFAWISVRDQMIRAGILINRLISREILPVDGGRLLIVGGGIAGVTAALEALKKNVAVTLVEAQDEFFNIFADATSRRIDPHLYRWPSDDWDEVKWNVDTPLCFDSSSAPLTITEPSMLCQEWRATIRRVEEVNSALFRYPAEYVSASEEEILIRATYKVRGHEEVPDPFHVILYASGAGEEITYLKGQETEFLGPKFWSKDTFGGNDTFDFRQPRLGRDREPKVFISGSGDGALQDYIRLLTGLHPGDLIARIEEKLSTETQWHKTKMTVLSAQNSAEREHMLSMILSETDQRHLSSSEKTMATSYKQCEERINSRLNEAVKESIENALYLPGSSTANLLDELFQELQSEHRVEGRSRPFLLSVRLAVSGDEFTFSYPLNRFLALLLSSYVTRHNAEISTVHYQTKVKFVTEHGSRYEVGTQPMIVDSEDIYDLVILRFGIKEAPLLYETNKPVYRRVCLPYPPLALH